MSKLGCFARRPTRRSLTVGIGLATLASAFTVAPAMAAPDTAIQAQVVGGSPVPDGKYPFVVLVEHTVSDSLMSVCTGSVIDPQWVITAAHCTASLAGTDISPASSFAVGWGTSNAHTMTASHVDRVLVHPSYALVPETGNSAPSTYDVALLHLTAPVPVKPVKLMSPSESDALQPGASVIIAGFGHSDPAGALPLDGQLREAALNVTDRSPAFLGLTSASTSACQGDSGGPALVVTGSEPVLAGISNLTVAASSASFCRPGHQESVYRAASGVLDWAQAAMSLNGTTISQEHGAAATTAGKFSAVSPRRVLDTRAGGPDGGRLKAGATYHLPVGGLRANTKALAMNVTAVNPDAEGVVQVRPCDRSTGSVFTLTYEAHTVVPNLAVIPTSADGRVCLETTSAVDLVLDLVGTYATDAGSNLTPIAPTRLVDTRTGPDPRGAPRRVGAGETLVLPVRGRAGVPADATAVLLNVTAVQPDADGFITAYPCDQPRPLASNLNPARGQIVANATTVALAANGSMCLYSYRATDLVVDLSGAYSPSASTALTSVLGVNVADGISEGQVLKPGTPLRIELAPARGLGPMKAVALDLTAADPDGPGYLTAYPCDQPRPTTSNVNYGVNSWVTNLAIVPVAADGSVCVFSLQPVRVRADVVGWFG
ncbi:MAG: hypothetical protein JWL70_2860 [Acidimicrobiia bacterium]|nr:hypothetical protein [Acidimicrobiia bacterium]